MTTRISQVFCMLMLIFNSQQRYFAEIKFSSILEKLPACFEQAIKNYQTQNESYGTIHPIVYKSLQDTIGETVLLILKQIQLTNPLKTQDDLFRATFNLPYHNICHAVMVAALTNEFLTSEVSFEIAQSLILASLFHTVLQIGTDNFQCYNALIPSIENGVCFLGFTKNSQINEPIQINPQKPFFFDINYAYNYLAALGLWVSNPTDLQNNEIYLNKLINEYFEYINDYLKQIGNYDLFDLQTRNIEKESLVMGRNVSDDNLLSSIDQLSYSSELSSGFIAFAILKEDPQFSDEFKIEYLKNYIIPSILLTKSSIWLNTQGLTDDILLQPIKIAITKLVGITNILVLSNKEISSVGDFDKQNKLTIKMFQGILYENAYWNYFNQFGQLATEIKIKYKPLSEIFFETFNQFSQFYQSISKSDIVKNSENEEYTKWINYTELNKYLKILKTNKIGTNAWRQVINIASLDSENILEIDTEETRLI